MDFAGFADIPVIDGHIHFVHPGRLEEMLAILDEVRCSRANLVCLPNPDATTHNPAALYFKEKHPRKVYISAALDYSVLADPSHAPEGLAAQIAALRAQGFDGLKMIEGKPQVRRLLPHPLNGPLYAGMWAAVEQDAFPVLIHVNDPDEFWDRDQCPPWARESGWDYSDGTCPSKGDLYAEMEDVLARHPHLKITFAHFYFLSRDLELAGRFLDAHPGACFDLAVHLDMYRDFSRDPETARAFFIRHQERIIYATDMDTRALERGAQSFMRFIPWLIRSMLERDEAFTTPDGSTYHGLGLPGAVLENIYHANFERVYGAVPGRLP